MLRQNYLIKSFIKVEMGHNLLDPHFQDSFALESLDRYRQTFY